MSEPYLIPTVEQQREMASKRAFGSVIPDQQFQRVERVQFKDGQDPGQAPGRAIDPQYASQLQSLGNRLRVMKIEPATVINMLPFELSVNSPMHDVGTVRIPAAVGEKEWTSYTWSRVSVEPQQIEGIVRPLEFYPIQCAEGFAYEFMREHGGVMVVYGNPDEETLAAYGPEMAACREQMIAQLLSLVTEANGYHDQGGIQTRWIVEKHRAAARKLHAIGRIPQLPPWIQPEIQMGEKVTRCPICQTKPAPGALQCKDCGRVLDVAAAFKANLIGETSLDLERLTRAEVEALGVSAYVAETSDEKPARLAKGLPRPVSVAEQNRSAAVA